jgi:hypothetical protein
LSSEAVRTALTFKYAIDSHASPRDYERQRRPGFSTGHQGGIAINGLTYAWVWSFSLQFMAAGRPKVTKEFQLSELWVGFCKRGLGLTATEQSLKTGPMVRHCAV